MITAGLAENGTAKGQFARGMPPGCNIAADDFAVEGSARPHMAEIEPLEMLDAEAAGQRDRCDRTQRHRRHGGTITQRSGHRLIAGLFERAGRQIEMHAVHQHIRGNQD